MTDYQVLARLNHIDQTLDAYANVLSDQSKTLGEILTQLHALREDVHTINTLLGIADLDPAQVRAAVFAGRKPPAGMIDA
ncbi:MAG: hypothetical protein OXC29_12855 [Rhodococcus sp.]|nr:hypothetical protein [Rhodococcus sp. (in: high G+C Gram-positive bacteria)]